MEKLNVSSVERRSWSTTIRDTYEMYISKVNNWNILVDTVKKFLIDEPIGIFMSVLIREKNDFPVVFVMSDLLTLDIDMLTCDVVIRQSLRKGRNVLSIIKTINKTLQLNQSKSLLKTLLSQK